MDKTNKKTNREVIIDPSNESKSNGNNLKPTLVGLDDKFPIQNFIELKSKQKNKDIVLQTYKYPSSKEKLKGVVYLM